MDEAAESKLMSRRRVVFAVSILVLNMLAFLLVLMTINYYGYALTCISLIVYDGAKTHSSPRC